MGPESETPLIEMRGLVKHFHIPHQGTLVAVDDVNLSIAKGETLGLVGESGSGKTTIGRLILRLTEPTAGEVLYNGERISDLKEKEFRRLRPKLQMVFQDPFLSLNPRMTMRNMLRDALHAMKLSGADRERRVDEVLEIVRVPPGLVDAHPEALTTSQQQRFAVARALMMEPDLIVLDEPVSNLDVVGRGEILGLLHELQDRLDVSYLFISHDLTAVRSVSKRIAVMYLGRIVEVEETDALFARPLHPYTRSLLGAVLYPDPNAAAPTYELSGEIPSPINLPIGCPLFSRCPAAEMECSGWEPQLLEISVNSSTRPVACRRAEVMLRAGSV